MTKISKFVSGIALLLLFPSFQLACFQLGEPPVKYAGDQFMVNFSYLDKPLVGSYVALFGKERKFSASSAVDKQGWVSFQGVPTGKYKLIFDGPSHESFEVDFSRSPGNRIAVFVGFYADYCRRVSVRPRS